MKRRTLLKICSLSWGAACAALLGVPVLGNFVSPLFRRPPREPEFTPVGRSFNFKVGGPPRLVFFTRLLRDAWTEREEPVSVWVQRLEKKEFRILSPVCPHLGCAIAQDRGGPSFACPCHNSSFTTKGAVAGGPAPRAMDPLEWRLEGNRLLVKYETFKSGLADLVRT